MSSLAEIVLDPHEKASQKWFAKAFGTLKYYADEHAAACAVFRVDGPWHLIYLLVPHLARKRKRAAYRLNVHAPEAYIWEPLRYEKYDYTVSDDDHSFDTSVFVPEGEDGDDDGDDSEDETAQANRLRLESRAQQRHFVWAIKALHLYGVNRAFSTGFGNIAYLKGTDLEAFHDMFTQRLKVACKAKDGVGRDEQKQIVLPRNPTVPMPRTLLKAVSTAPKRLFGRALVLRNTDWDIWWCQREDESDDDSSMVKWCKERHVPLQESYAYLFHAAHQPGSRLRAVPSAQIWANFLNGERDIGEERVQAAMRILADHYLTNGQDEEDADSVIGVNLNPVDTEAESDDDSGDQDSGMDGEQTDGGGSQNNNSTDGSADGESADDG